MQVPIEKSSGAGSRPGREDPLSCIQVVSRSNEISRAAGWILNRVQTSVTDTSCKSSYKITLFLCKFTDYMVNLEYAPGYKDILKLDTSPAF